MTTHTLDALDEARPQTAKPKSRDQTANGHSQLAGTIWFIGWLFTIGYAHLVWWKAVLAVLAWPYFLGTTVH